MPEVSSVDAASIVRMLPITSILANTERTFDDKGLSDPEMALRSISRFGFQNSSDVTNFLSSTEGKAALKLIVEELHLREKQEENLRAAIERMELIKQIRIGLLILALMYKRERHEHIEHAIEYEREAKEKAEELHKKAIESATPEQIAAYEKVLETVRSVKIDKVKEIQSLDARISEIDLQILVLEHQREENLEAIDDIYNEYDAHLNPETDVTATNTSARDSYRESLEKRIAELQSLQAAEETTEILATEPQPKEQVDLTESVVTYELLPESISKQQIQLQALAQILQALRGDTHFYDFAGNRCQSPHDAHYIVPSDRVVSILTDENGNQKYYLIPKGKDVKEFSEEAKEQAHKEFGALPLMAKAKLKLDFGRKLANFNTERDTCVLQRTTCKEQVCQLETQEKALESGLNELKARQQCNNGRMFTKDIRDVSLQSPSSGPVLTPFTAPTPFSTIPRPKGTTGK